MIDKFQMNAWKSVRANTSTADNGNNFDTVSIAGDTYERTWFDLQGRKDGRPTQAEILSHRRFGRHDVSALIHNFQGHRLGYKKAGLSPRLLRQVASKEIS